MSFMQTQTFEGEMASVETNCGDWLVDPEYVNFDNPSDALEYTEGTEVYGIALVKGWFSRLSAPGYLDCTDWHGPLATEADALEELEDMYGSES